MAKDVSPEEALEFYASKPEDMQAALRESALYACRAQGVEPTPEIVEVVIADAVRYLMDNIYARFSEITSEEAGRIIDEEFERLDDGEGVDEAELVSAVTKRVDEEYKHLLIPGRPERPNRGGWVE